MLITMETAPHWVIAAFTILNVIVLAWTLKIFNQQFVQMFIQTRELAEPYLRLKLADHAELEAQLDDGNQMNVHELTDWLVFNEGKANALDLRLYMVRRGRLQPIELKHIPFIRSSGDSVVMSPHVKRLYEQVPDHMTKRHDLRNKHALGDDWLIHVVYLDRGRERYHAEFRFAPEYNDGFEIITLEQKMTDRNHACTLPAVHQPSLQ